MTLHEVLLNSTEVKKLIIERSFKYRIPLRDICSEVGLEYKGFMKGYINATNPSDLTEDQFTEILKILGISIRYQVVIDKTVDMEAVSKTIEEKYRLRAEKKRLRRNEFGK